ncbi:MAG: T9SS type A sorting domain-containing protein [Cytophagales bacterium]|nr:T9SS type A sorting domain-containing protein [Cytophagales bacterium]
MKTINKTPKKGYPMLTHTEELQHTGVKSLPRWISYYSTRGLLFNRAKTAIVAVSIIACCLLPAANCFSQSLQWAFGMGDTSDDLGFDIVLDGSGNIYVTGSFMGTLEFVPALDTLISAGKEDIFLAKFDSSGSLIWARRAGGDSTDEARSVALDDFGNIYITGNFSDTAYFGADTLIANSSAWDIFLAKYDASGFFIGAVGFGSSGTTRDDFGRSISTDASGNVYVTGVFTDTADFDPGPGTDTLISNGNDGMFIVKFDSAGNHIWAFSIDGTANPNNYGPWGFIADASGNLYITGVFEGIKDFDPVGTVNLTAVDSAEIFLAKYDSSGNIVWAKSMGGSGIDKAYSISQDIFGNIYISGEFTGTANFNPAGTDTLVSNGVDVFLAKYDPSGNYLWAFNLDNVAGLDVANYIVNDEVGNVYLSAIITGTTDFNPGPGTDTLTNAGDGDIFIAKYDSAGGFLSVVSMGGPGFDLALGIEADALGNLFLTGVFSDTADFDPGVGITNLISNGGFEIFIAKYSTPPPPLAIAFIPDTNFRNFLVANYPTFMDANDSLLIDSAATLTGTLDCSAQNIADLTGVQYFVNIGILYCFNNQLTALPDLSNNTALQQLHCAFNQLTALPDLSNNTALLRIYCYSNQLTALPALTNNTALQWLYCYNNQLTTLPDLTNNTTLQQLRCYNNPLTALPDLTNNIALQWLDCYNNKLDFSDARELRIADIISTLTTYTYSPQNPFGVADTFNLYTGYTLSLSIASQDSALSYQWFRGTDTIAGATDTLLVIPNVTLADSGVYICRSYGTALDTNNMIFVPGITEFVSEPFTVIIVPDTRPKAFIPDTNFRAFLNTTYPTFMDGSGDSLLIDSAATLTGTLNCSAQNIADLTGVQYFVNIGILYCFNNQLTALLALDSLTSLQQLYCNNNQLTALPDLSANTALQQLYCNANQLTALPDLSANTALQVLNCVNNQLTALPDLSANTALQFLYCYNNQLTALPDLSANTALQGLYCYGNKLDFSDARELRIADTISSLIAYTYSPQNPFGVADTFNFFTGDTLKLSIANQDSALSYQWFRGVDTIAGATDTLLVIPNATLADSGVYTSRSYGTALDTNNMIWAPGITEFVSEPFTVNISSMPPFVAKAFIPDTNFRNFLNATYPGFMVGDSLLIDSAATLTGTLNCSAQNIADLTGVEYFVNIAWLYCYTNLLTALPALGSLTALQRLICYSNYLTVLPDFSANTALQYLQCHFNQLTALPALDSLTALQRLLCDNNLLTALPDLTINTALQILSCFNNQLTSLPDLSANPALLILDCQNNKFDFSDARELRIADTISTLIAYSYSPQNPFGVADTFNLNMGDTLVLSIASQDSALSYQWFRGADTIAGGTDTLLIIPNVTVADSGVYTCRSYGTALDTNNMTFAPGIISFVSEPLSVKINMLPSLKAFIPDTNFRNFLVANYPSFMDANDSLLIDSAATLTGTLDCNSQNIADLTGVEYFVNITWLYCQINQLTSLPDLSANTSLTRLICSANQLTTLPDLSANTTLLWIYCQSNLLDSLPDLTNNTALTELRCHTNQLTALPNLSANIALTQLQCYNNQLTVLPDLSNNTSLVLLYCFDNQLTSLPDLSANTALVDLRCLNNKFDFSDARELRIADTTSTLTTYFYSPQNPFGMADTFNFNEGDTLILSIASQDSALSYQWFRGTDTITGATDTLLTIPNVTLADSGIYTCRSYGTALLFPSHMSFSPGISSFVSEPFKVNIFSGALTASISYIKNVSCNGVQDGEAAVTATGGTPPYTYQWDDPLAQTTDTAKYLLAGNYSVIVTDSAGAVDTAFVTITEPFVLTAIITGTNVTSCGGSDGAANLIVSGGTQPYTFNWLSGDTTEDLAGLSAGTYSVSVTDSNGCTANASVTISEPPAITLGIIGTDVTTCGGSNGTANLTVIGGVAPYTFIWSTGATTEDITSLVPGTYSVTVIDSNGCTVSDAVTISGFATITVSFTTTGALCNGQCDGSATVTASGGTPPYTYLWSDGQTDSTAANLCAGTYNIIVTDANACEATGSVNVSEPAPLTLTMTTFDATCGNSDGIAIVSASGGIAPYEYSWSSGDTTETDSALAAGINYVIVTDTNGCIAYGVAAISNTTPTITLNSVVNLNCSADADGSIDISVSGGLLPYTFLWSNGGTTEDISGLIGGIYEVTVADSTGCIATQSITVSAPAPLTLSVTEVDASCNGSDGSATVNVSGGTPPYSYFWSTFGTDSSQSGLAAGIYLVNVFDANGCFNSITAVISNAGGPVITLNLQTNTSCGSPSGGAIDINVTGGALPYTYLWSNGLTTQDINNLTDTSYNVIITDSNGCIGTASFSISQKLPLSQAICIVTVDSATGKNLIVWEKNPGPSFYNIYKEGTAANVYFLLASVPYDSVSTFLDILADPKQRSWRYKITAVDSCGNESALSQLHKTMHLTMNLGLGGVINLIWDHYEGFNFGTYYIYRGTLALPSLDSIYAIASNNHSWTDLNPPVTPELFYQVAAVHPTECSPTFLTLGALGTPDQKKVLVYNSARSNVSNRLVPTGIPNLRGFQNLVSFNVYPNPYMGKTEITWFLNKKANVSLEVYNILGKKIEILVNEEQISGKHRYSFSAKGLGYTSGVYVLKLIVDDGVYTKQLVEF